MPAEQLQLNRTPKSGNTLKLSTPALITRVEQNAKSFAIWRNGSVYITVGQNSQLKGVLPPGTYILKTDAGGSATLYLTTRFTAENIVLWGRQRAVIKPAWEGNYVVLAAPTWIIASTYDGAKGMGFFDRMTRVLYFKRIFRTVRNEGAPSRRTMAFAYGYDDLNRLSGFSYDEPGFGGGAEYAFTADEFGNLTARDRVTQTSTTAPPSASMPADRATNRLSGVPYDPLGNQTRVTSAGQTLDLAYLDPGHVLTVGNFAQPSQVLYRYYYDASGKRRITAWGDGSGLTGAARIADNASFCFYEGESLLCQQDRGSQVRTADAYAAKFLLTDHLGSTRASLSFTSNHVARITDVLDPMPYGELITAPPLATESVFFTGKQRDAETGLDFFGARYYSSPLGRWTSPDQPFTDTAIVNPQTWNRFSYAHNNTLLYVDPDGREVEVQISADFERGTAVVVITGNIAVYPDGDSLANRPTFDQVRGEAARMQKQIREGWSGTFMWRGLRCTVDCRVTVEAYQTIYSAKSSHSDNVPAIIKS